MFRALTVALLTVCVLFTASAGSAFAQTYRVTITNLTKGQTFTPVLLATHSPTVRLFAPGTAASSQLQAIAEEGDTTTMAALLRGMTADVREVVVAAAVGGVHSVGLDGGLGQQPRECLHWLSSAGARTAK